ncbi:MAG TPA: hypothetical protein VN151_04455, partial [Terracidiphilus sp.]|nr:hypothetical protein [Terracidiphilus sp.]
MAARAQNEFVVVSQTSAQSAEVVTRERKKSLMLRAWIVAGLFFMALPGTLLGFSNLLAISAHHGSAFLPAAWMEGHGHAQVFGWIGSFILGIGFYSQPGRGRNALHVPLACFVLWTSGVALRWFANIYEWNWQVLVPLSAGMELLTMLLFLSAAMHHKRPGQAEEQSKKAGMELWMIAVLMSTVGLTAVVIFNFAECVRLALAGVTPSFPHALDQRYLVLLGWGFLAPVVWGFSARWLPVFLGLAPLRQRLFGMALALDAAGVLLGEAGAVRAAVLLIAAGAVACAGALRFFERPHAAAKTLGVHPSFPIFVRLPYVWLVIAGTMSVWAAWTDMHGG